MTEEQIKKGSTLLYRKKEAEDYLATLDSPKVKDEGIKFYLNDFDEDMRTRWIALNRCFFAGEVERLRQELESL